MRNFSRLFRRHFWGLVAIFCFGVSAGLLSIVTYHEFVDATTYAGVRIALLGTKADLPGEVALYPPLGSFPSDLKGPNVEVELRAYFPTRTSVVRKPVAVFVAGAEAYRCFDDDSSVVDEKMDDDSRVVKHRYRQAFFVSKIGYILCSFKIPPFKQSATERVVSVSLDGTQLDNPNTHVPLHLRLANNTTLKFNVSRFQQEDNVHVDGPDKGGEELLHGSDDTATVSWRDVDAEQWRDIFLALIGTLTGTGAAALFEWMRPALAAKSE